MASQQEVEQFIRATSKQMVAYLQDKYRAPEFNPIIKITFSQNRRISRGGIKRGIPFINLVAWRFVLVSQSTGMTDEPEYKSFNRDPVIGGLYNITWKKALASLIAHELGHAAQYDRHTKVGAKKDLNIENLDDRNEILRGHDWFWKRIYADLRIRFVNGNDFPLSAPVPAVNPPVVKPPVVKPVEIKVTSVAAPVQAPVATPDNLYVKYQYKGNRTFSWYYVSQKLALVLVEENRKFYRYDVDTEQMTLLAYTTLAECRRNLIGM